MYRRIAFLAVFAALLGFASEFKGDTEKDITRVLSRRNWWSFQPVKRPDVPRPEGTWARSPIDAFLLEAMRAKGLEPSREASREQWIRRVTLDLTGLPPRFEDVQAFVRDAASDAYERVVDRLMASPQYGERWAQRWLDVVRYADTNGFELDVQRTNAWRYRDYVIRSFNADKPFDRFLKEQIAGDEIYPGDKDALVALGFHRAGPEHLVGGNQDVEMNRQEVLVEMSAGISNAFLGLTLNCARCHNHKFDPLLQSDYYRLQAVFANTVGKDVEFATPEEKARYDAELKAYKARLKPVEDAIAAIEKPYRERIKEEKKARLDPKLRALLDVPKDKLSDADKMLQKDARDQIAAPWDEVLAALPADEKARRAELRKQLHDIELDEPEPPPTAYAVVNADKPAEVNVLKVGDHKMKLGVVGPAVPVVLASHVERAVPPELTGRRTALAEWLADPKHPLTARVFVNRIWQFRMGRGIVGTPNDFGALGERPTNPKLLDWLASEFMERNWSVKAIDRMIVLSAAYRQTSAIDPKKQQIDPDNKLYSRMNRRRLEGEAIRDSVLAVNGRLNMKMFGKPVRTPIEREIYDIIFTEAEPDNLWPLPRDKREMDRRSIYLLNKRTVRLPMLANFDQPDTMSSCAFRPVSTHALQALTLMNSDFMADESNAFADRLLRELRPAAGMSRTQVLITDAYRLALGRAPSAAEMRLGLDFMKQGGRLPEFCLALLNRSEFLYIP